MNRLLINRRRHQRVHNPTPVRFHYLDQESERHVFEGRIVDVSACGFGLQLPRSFWGVIGVPSGARIELRAPKSSPRRFTARVVRFSRNSNVVGIEFDRPYYDLLPTLTDRVELSVEIHEDQSTPRLESRFGPGSSAAWAAFIRRTRHGA